MDYMAYDEPVKPQFQVVVNVPDWMREPRYQPILDAMAAEIERKAKATRHVLEDV